jgi:hypothetical protein
MTCDAINDKTGSMCEREYPHPGKRHRLSFYNRVEEWDDSDVRKSPWNQDLSPVITKPKLEE